MDTAAQLQAALAGRYEVERQIGAGGMATVYLARDSRHDRPVALKVLNPELGAVLGVDRFLAEIRVTANLQHPNLLPLFDSGEANGLLYYVMPFIEGESLRAHLEREKQLPIEETVRIATAVAAALEYAHAHGVIHRDLKPENILLQAGQPVVADFGIALAVSRAGGARITQTGLSLGTPQYMSPEQATGDRMVDARTDVYSLGAVTYEMLTGEPPHTGSTVQAVVAKVLTDTPRSIRLTRPNVPEHVAYAVHRALEKLPADRWPSAHEMAECLAGRGTVDVSAARDAAVTAPRTIGGRRRRALTLAAAVAIVAVAGIVGWSMGVRGRPTAPTVRFPLSFPAGEHLFVGPVQGPTLAISPDGKWIVHVTTVGGAQPHLLIRSLDSPTPRALAGTEGAFQPFFSPDGQSIGFVVEGQLRKLSLLNGTISRVADLADVSQVFGAAWVAEDRIIVAFKGRLFTVSPGGASPPAPLVSPPAGSGANYRWPSVIPGTNTVLFDIWKGVPNTAEIAALPLDDGNAAAVKPLGINGTAPLGVVDGTLLYVRATPGAIFGVPFRVRGLRTTAAPSLLVDSVNVGPTGAPLAALSRTGSVVYQVGSTRLQLVLADSTGASRPVLKDALRMSYPRFSPDGERIAVALQTQTATDIHIYDINAGTLTRLTTVGASNDRPAWTPDGKRIAYRSLRNGSAVWWQSADGTGAAEPLVSVPGKDIYEADISPDGRNVAYRVGSAGSADLWYRGFGNDTTSKEISALPQFVEWSPRFSPDGRWIAYASDESGKLQIYVRPFPGPGPKIQVSVDGGVAPVWAPDGRRLFYRNGSDLVVAFVMMSPTFGVQGRHTLFSGDYIDLPGHANYDVAPDGKHFLMLKPAENGDQVMVAHNWLTEMRTKMEKPSRQ